MLLELDFSQVWDLTGIACLGFMPDRELEIVAKDLSEHALKILVGIINAPRAKIRGYPVVDCRNFPLEVQECGRSASRRTMNPAPSSFSLKIDSLFLPYSSRS